MNRPAHWAATSNGISTGTYDFQGLAAQYQIRSIPTLLILKNGAVAEQMIGAKSKRDLKASLDRAAA